MRCVVWLVLIAGCYSPTIAPGAPCDSACPGDLVCLDHVCRLPGDTPADARLQDAFVAIDTLDGPPGDVDADGVIDTADNCPAKANADQHDEDGDAIGDVCDPCPHLATGNTDSDGDGVGDACDPQPAVAKQRIAFFDPFTSDRAEWVGKSNASRVGETLRFDSTASYAGALLAVSNAETRIVTAGTIASVIANASSHQIAINFSRNQAATVYHYTEFYDSGGAQGDIAISRANNGVYTSFATAHYTGILPTGAWSMRVDTSVANQRITFVSSVGNVSPNLSATANSPALIASNTIGLDFHGADVRLDYFLVIETIP